MKRMVTDMKHGMMMRMDTKMINAADKEKIRKGKELLDNHLYDEAREILEEYTYSFGPCAFWLGWMYEFAECVEKDDVQAIHWYQTAGDLGEIKACYNLAQAYWWGRPRVEQDKAKAITYYAKAAESGDSNAQFQMGYAYFTGIGIEKISKKGFRGLKGQRNKIMKWCSTILDDFTFLTHQPTGWIQVKALSIWYLRQTLVILMRKWLWYIYTQRG